MRRAERVDGEQGLTRSAIACSLLALVALAYDTLRRYLDPDEIEHMHSAWLTWQGDTPYLDFFQHHHSLIWYWLAPAISAWGERASTILLGRISMWPFLLLTLLAVYLLTRRMFGVSAAWVAVALTTVSRVIADKMIEVRPDNPQTAVGLLSLALLFWRDERETGPGVFFWVGALNGLAFIFLQKSLFLTGAIGVVLLWRLFRGVASIRSVAFYVGGFALPATAYVGWIVSQIGISEYVLLNWTLNLKLISRGGLLLTVQQILTTDILIILLATLGAATLTRRGHYELLVILALTTSVLAVGRTVYLQYWLPITPLICVFAARGVLSVRNPRIRLTMFFLAFLVAAVLGRRWYTTNDGQMACISEVLAGTTTEDRIHDGVPLFNVFRRHVDYFWFGVVENHLLDTYRMLRPYEYDIYESIERVEPKAVSAFHVDASHPALDDYEPVAACGDNVLLRRP